MPITKIDKINNSRRQIFHQNALSKTNWAVSNWLNDPRDLDLEANFYVQWHNLPLVWFADQSIEPEHLLYKKNKTKVKVPHFGLFVQQREDFLVDPNGAASSVFQFLIFESEFLKFCWSNTWKMDQYFVEFGHFWANKPDCKAFSAYLRTPKTLSTGTLVGSTVSSPRSSFQEINLGLAMHLQFQPKCSQSNLACWDHYFEAAEFEFSEYWYCQTTNDV